MASIALATGLICSVFAVVHAAFLTDPPFRDPGTLVSVWQTSSPASERAQDYIQPARAEEWANVSDLRFMEGIAATGMGRQGVLSTAQGPLRVEVAAVLGDWFGVTGVDMAWGRGLTAADGEPGAEAAAVVSHSLWRDRLGERQGTIRLGERTFTVVGVMPASLPAGETVWLPVGQAPPEMAPLAYAPIARLRGGATVEQARSEIRQMAAGQVASDSARYGGMGATALLLGDMDRGGVRDSLWLVVGVLATVLLLALTNLTNLFLVRARAERRNLRVRVSLGARPWQAGGHLAWEATVVALAGSGAGLLLAIWGTDLALLLLRSEVVLRTTPRIGPGTAAVALTSAVLVAGVLAGESLRFAGKLGRSPIRARGAEETTHADGDRRFGHSVLAAQVAISLLLVAVLSVFRSAHDRLSRLDVGYDAGQVVMADPDLPLAGIDGSRRWEFANRVVDRVRSQPGLDGATAWRLVGMDYPPRPELEVVVEGGRSDVSEAARLYQFYEVMPPFFETMGMRILQGRALTERDRGSPTSAAVVSLRAAQTWWPGEDPIGKGFKLGQEGRWITVVGVSDDTQRLDWLGRVQAIRHRRTPVAFVPAGQLDPLPPGWRPYEFWGDVKIGARGTSPELAQAALHGVMLSQAPQVPLTAIGPMLELQMREPNAPGAQLALRGMLVGLGAVAAVALMVIGVTGVVGDAVERRKAEVGIRVALGAEHRDVLRLVTVEGIRVVLIGLLAGAAGVWVIERLLGAGLFGYYGSRLTDGLHDPVALAIALGVVLGATGGAMLAGARKALRLDPAEALRAE